MNKNGFQAVIVLGVFGAFSASAWGADLIIQNPPSRIAVPTDGSVAYAPYSARLTAFDCVAPSFFWKRDGSDSRSCEGNSCTISYYESASSRGVRTASVTAHYNIVDSAGRCWSAEKSSSKSYIVQYQPTASIVSAPSALVTDSVGQFFGAGEVDTDYSLNKQPSYTWTFGDGYVLSGPDVSHSYSVPGQYNVTLSVNDGAFQATTNLAVNVALSDPSVPQPDVSIDYKCANFNAAWIIVDMFMPPNSPSIARYVVERYDGTKFYQIYSGLNNSTSYLVSAGRIETFRAKACSSIGCGAFAPQKSVRAPKPCYQE